jgi:hypothetical protein
VGGASETSFSVANKFFVYDSLAGAMRLVLDTTGKLGIGTSSPDANLTVNGAASFAAGTALLPSIARAGDLNTGIFFPAADTIAFAEGGAEAMRLNSSGNVLVGSSVLNTMPIGAGLIQVQTPNSASNISIIRNTVNGASPNLIFGKSRAGTAGGTTVVVGGDIMGSVFFNGADGTDLISGAAITGEVDSTPGTGSMPGRLVFKTSATGSSTPTERLRIDSTGNVGIGTNAPSASAILDAQSTTKGVRMPNMTTAQKNAIASPAAGLMVYDTTLAKLCVYTTAWETITSL